MPRAKERMCAMKFTKMIVVIVVGSSLSSGVAFGKTEREKKCEETIKIAYKIFETQREIEKYSDLGSFYRLKDHPVRNIVASISNKVAREKAEKLEKKYNELIIDFNKISLQMIKDCVEQEKTIIKNKIKEIDTKLNQKRAELAKKETSMKIGQILLGVKALKKDIAEYEKDKEKLNTNLKDFDDIFNNSDISPRR